MVTLAQSRNPKSFFVSVKDYGAEGDGSTDDRAAIQRALDAIPTRGGAVVIPPGSYVVGGPLVASYPTMLVGAGRFASVLASVEPNTASYTAGPYLIRALSSLYVAHLGFLKAASVTNTPFKAVTLDGGASAMEGGTVLLVDDCKITGFDMGVYCDGGGGSRAVVSAMVRSCDIAINTSGTGGAASVRPTIAIHNCELVQVLNNKLDATDPTLGLVNNLYHYGNKQLVIRGNHIIKGIGVKILTSSGNDNDVCIVAENWFDSSASDINLLPDTATMNAVRIENNYFDSSRCLGTATVPFAICLLGSNAAVVRNLRIADNFFRGVVAQCVDLNVPTGCTLLAAIFEGNHYYGFSTTSTGTYPAWSTGGAGTFGSVMATGEIADGQSTGKQYTDGGAFTRKRVRGLTEINTTVGTPALGPEAHVYHNANQSIASNTLTTLAFNSERVDGEVIHDTVTNNSRLTCRTPGTYIIIAQVQFAAGTGTLRDILILVNGSTVGSIRLPPIAGVATTFQCTAQWRMAVGDYAEVMVQHDNAAAINVLFNNMVSPEFSMARVGD